MNKSLPPEENSLTTPVPGIHMQVEKTTVDAGIQAITGNNNIQLQGDSNVITFNRTEILQISVEEIKTREFIQASPYKGLRKFESADKDLFFGRDQFLTSLVNELEQSNLILLLGASGSGKSSVVRAGLIPWLSQKYGTRLVNLKFTPDIDPFESFYASLLNNYTQTEAQIAREAKADTLIQVVERLKQSDDYWFISIDQFEELFTTGLADKRDQFIKSLVKLSKTKHSSIKIMGTMRADFFDRLSPYPQLVKATDKHRPLITEMQPDELRLAIEQPAAHHGVVFETGLVEKIIKDVQGQAGYLPLLQYTLNLLWEVELRTSSINDRTLNLSSYRQLGGVRGALQKHVNYIYDTLPEVEKLPTQRIFLKLVDVGKSSEVCSEWKPVRRRALRSEFSDEFEQIVLIKLINENLLVSDSQPQSQESTVEIAHEILLTSWTTLKTWIEENRHAIALRNRLNDDVANWQVKKANDELWSGAKLEKAVELRKDPTFNQVLGGFSDAANQFIDASVERSDRQLRRAKIFAGVGFTLAALTTITSIFAFTQWNDAQQQSIVSLNQVSESSLLSNKQLEALVAAVQAGKQLKNAILKPNAALQQTAIATLQQAIYGVQERNRLTGHKSYINIVSFSPDGQMIASGSNDDTIKLWSREGNLLKSIPNPKRATSSISFSPDSKTIVSGNYHGTIQLWSQEGQLIKEFPKEHSQRINSISLSPDGQMIASGGYDRTIKLWTLDGRLLKTLSGHRDKVRSVTFSPDGQMIASISADETINLWSREGKLLHTFCGFGQDMCGETGDDDVGSVTFSSDGQIIASGGYDGTVKLWSRNGQLLKSLPGHTNRVTNISFSRDGNTIASSSHDGTVKLWSRNGQLLQTLSGHQGLVSSISFSPDGNTLASASWDLTIRLWKLERQPLQTLSGHTEDVDSVSFSPDGKTIASGSWDNTIKLWSRDGQLLQTLDGHTSGVTSVSFSPNGQVIASGGYDGTVKLWSLDGQLLKSLSGHTSGITSVSFSSDSQVIASSGYDGTVKLWSLDGQLLKSLFGHTSGVTSVSFSPDGRVIASGGDDSTVKLWSRDGQLLQTLDGHRGSVTSVSFSPDGKTLASASQDSTVNLWSLNSQNPPKTLAGHGTVVTSVSFSPDGNTLASADQASTVKFWSRDGQKLKTLTGYSSHIKSVSVSFSPDGKMLTSTNADNTVILWNFDLDDLLVRGCDWLHDYLKNESANLSESDRHLCNGIED